MHEIIPFHELARLRTIQRFLDLNINEESELRDIVKMVAEQCGVPLAAITLANGAAIVENSLGYGFLGKVDFFYDKVISEQKLLVFDEAELKDLWSNNIAGLNNHVSIIGHDLRSPIGGIPQLLTMIEDGEIRQEERAEIFAMIKRQAEVSLEILNSLLSWGQTQLTGIEVHLTFFNPGKVVLKNIEAFNVQLQKKSIEIVNEIPDTLVVHGDINHFDFIIRNLLSNAIKFSYDDGIIYVSSNLTSANDHVVFSVKDLGRGITAQQLRKFPLESLDVTFGTDGKKGTGFGLMLSKEFIKANQGRLWVESIQENGTTFYFTFPIAK